MHLQISHAMSIQSLELFTASSISHLFLIQWRVAGRVKERADLDLMYSRSENSKTWTRGGQKKKLVEALGGGGWFQ